MAKFVTRSQSSSKLSSKEPPNPVNRDRILAESVRKELHQLTLFTEFTVNPHKPGALIDAIKRGRQVPREKHVVPQTSSQEIGWLSKPLIEPLDRIDARFNHAKRTTDATRFQEEMWHFMKPKKSSSVHYVRSDKGSSLHD